MILLNVIGLTVIGALVLRGAYGFLEDWAITRTITDYTSRKPDAS